MSDLMSREGWGRKSNYMNQYLCMYSTVSKIISPTVVTWERESVKGSVNGKPLHFKYFANELVIGVAFVIITVMHLYNRYTCACNWLGSLECMLCSVPFPCKTITDQQILSPLLYKGTIADFGNILILVATWVQRNLIYWKIFILFEWRTIVSIQFVIYIYIYQSSCKY